MAMNGVPYWRELDLPESQRVEGFLALRMYRFDVGVITEHFNEEECQYDMHFFPGEVKVVFRREKSQLIYASVWLWTTKI
jgi:hypothetical protein